MRRLSNVADSKVELLVQFFQVPADQIAHLHMLQMLPSPFVSRVQIGSVLRQGFQPHLAARVRDEPLDFRLAVDG
jgi:hypothetical protein